MCTLCELRRRRWRLCLVVAALSSIFHSNSIAVAFTVTERPAQRFGSSTILYDSLEGSTESSQSIQNATTAVISQATKDELLSTDEPNAASTPRMNSSSWARNLKEAAGTFGDIMSLGNINFGDPSSAATKENLTSTLTQRDGLVTSAMQSGTLASRYGIEHPLDRMALTANGNLQRLVSSYYDAPVQVLVDKCEPITDNDELLSFPQKLRYSKPQAKRWDRTVHLMVHNQTFCVARSLVSVYDPLCQSLVESGQVGLGQLFRYLDILPEFELHDAGPHPAETGGGFWREYSLRCAELTCDIHEDFRSGIWDLHPKER